MNAAGGLLSLLTPRQAAQVAIGLLVAASVGFAAAIYLDFCRPYQPTSPSPVPTGDLKFYRAVAEDVRGGGEYYDVTGRRLRALGYPVSSVFRWRLPTLTWLAASLPNDAWFRGMLILLWAGGIGLSLGAVRGQTGVVGRLVLFVGLLGVAYWSLDGMSQYTHELWAAAFILLSASLIGLGRHWLALVAGLAALSIREHALMYCLVAAGLAAWQNRKLEAAVWLAGIAAFAAFLTWHGGQVLAHVTPAELAESPGVRPWIRFGGLEFVLLTARMNVILFHLPGWVAYLALVASLLGMTEIGDELGALLLGTTLLYLAAYAVVGQEFNGYWGLLYAPLLPFGLAHAYPFVKRLIAATRNGTSV
jgi:hypothetical protein